MIIGVNDSEFAGGAAGGRSDESSRVAVREEEKLSRLLERGAAPAERDLCADGAWIGGLNGGNRNIVSGLGTSWPSSMLLSSRRSSSSKFEEVCDLGLWVSGKCRCRNEVFARSNAGMVGF